MRSTWTEISCTVPESLVDLFADFLVQLSGSGVCIENLSVDTFSASTIQLSPSKTIKAYFSAEASLEEAVSSVHDFLRRNREHFPGELPSPTTTRFTEEDWANNWKQHFKPSRIGRHLVIKPTWEDFTAEPGDVIIELDPGQAFGTGTHPTTRLCLEAIERLLSRPSGKVPAAVLDVGTGSGVLAIAAMKMGADRIYAIDIDPDAVSVARENLVLNGIVDDTIISTAPLAKVPGSYNIVVANIIAEELVKLASQLLDKIADGGYLILSGILNERESLVINGFAPFPLSEPAITRLEEWSCLTYRLEK